MFAWPIISRPRITGSNRSKPSASEAGGSRRLRASESAQVDELAWHHLQAQQWDALERILTNLDFLEAKTEAGMVFDLVQDFSAAIANLPPMRPTCKLVKLLEQAIRYDIQFVSRYPTTLFQCVWNSGWW